MMRRVRSVYSTRRGAVLALFALGLVFLMAAQIDHGKFSYNDFGVYHKAGQRVLAGEDLYRPVEDGFYRYLYSPTGAISFIPISFLPLPVAKVVYWYLLTGLILGVHIQRKQLLGQVNHVLLVMYLVMVYCFAQRKRVLLAAVWAAGIFIKPLGFIFLPYFVLRRRWAEVALFSPFVVILFAAPLLFYSPADYGRQLQGQAAEIEIELMEKQGMLRAANHTVFSVLARYSPLRAVEFTPARARAYEGIVLAGLAAFVCWIVVRRKPMARGS